MKKKISIFFITAMFLTNVNSEIIDNKKIIVNENTHIKGIIFQDVGIAIEKGSILEKEILEVLKKNNIVEDGNKKIFDSTLEKISSNELNINKLEKKIIISDIESEEIKGSFEQNEESIKGEDIVIDLKRCFPCHGENFEISAQDKSKIVKDMTKNGINNALNGYKSGLYGGELKNVMKEELRFFNKEDLKLISEQILNKTYKANLKDNE